MSHPGRDALVAMLSRLKNDLLSVNLSKPDVARATLQGKYPLSGDYLVEVRRLCQRGVEEGWLCDSGPGEARTTSLAKTSKYFPFSIDATQMRGGSGGHGHPKGEVNLCWALDGSPSFCGNSPGWVVFPPGSKHVPRVSGGWMFVLHFLPQGLIDRDVKIKTDATAKRPAVASPSSGPGRPAVSVQAATRARTTDSATRATRTGAVPRTGRMTARG